MNKTVTINISGIIFHIEEDAYDKLSKYLSTIRGYFKATEGRDEIMADIESRIAEMLKEKTSTLKQVVLMADVDAVIEVMGKPEQFAENGEGQSETKEEQRHEEHATGRKRARRVFRDPDSKIVGGVCSGIAAYFDMDPLWLRLAWVGVTLLGGAGILIYIIMWIVIPKATTTAEKLEMRGEEVNINNIKRNFEDELEGMKKKVKDFESEAKEFGRSFKRGGERRDAAERFGDFLKEVFGGAFRIIGRIFAVFLIVIAAVLMIGLLGSLFGFGMVNNISLNHLSDLVFSGSGQSDLAVVGLMLAAGVPLIMLIYGGVRTLFQIKIKNRILNYTSTSLWLVGVFILLYVGYSVSSEFSEQGRSTNNVQLVQPKCDTLFLRVAKNDKYDMEEGSSWHHGGDWDIVTEDGDQVMLGFPEMKIVQSEDSAFHLDVVSYARGFDSREAQARAKKIKYNVVQKDSLLEFPLAYEIDKRDKWRGQDIKMTLYVPKNKMIFLSRNMRRIIYNVDNVTDTWDGDMVNRRWVMTDDGLACVDCNGLDLPSKKHHFKIKHPFEKEEEYNINSKGN